MSEPSCDTLSVLRYVLHANTRLCAYAYHAKKQGLNYRQFVEMLEVTRRDVMKTPDGVLMNPECNDNLDLVRITAAWNALKLSQMNFLYMKN